MHYWSLGWQDALGLSAALLGLSLLLRRRGRHPSARYLCQETGIVFALYALWQVGGAHAHTEVAGARAHALAIWHAERWLHLPSEVAVQRAFLPHPELVRWMDNYYAGLHLTSMLVLLVWVMWRHRSRYAFVRSVVVVVTGACLLIQLVPVAPPRMFPELGFVDTGLRYGQSVYGSVGSGSPEQLAAMPSVHIAWAVLVAATIIALARSRWRLLAAVHPVLTLLVVTVTANHWWLDGAAAVATLAASYALCRAAAEGWRWVAATPRTAAVRVSGTAE